jgi:acyl dehydratase
MARQPSHLPPLARLVRQSLRGGRGGSPVREEVPGRRLAVESGEIRPEPRRVARYLRATHGDRISALASDGTLSPTYAATWETALALELLARAGGGLPRRGMVHLESELVQLRGLRADESIRCRLELDRTLDTSRGRILQLRGRSWNGSGHLALEGSTTLLLPGGEPGAKRGGPAGEREPQTAAPGEWSELATWELGGGHGRRYARASGDFNPIHLWRFTARALGFAGPILHGFCTQALVAHALIERRCAGDPSGLRRLRIAFRAPLFLPASVRLLVLPGETAAAGSFRVVTAEQPERPVAEGEFVAGSGGSRVSS